VLENQLAVLANEQSHRGARRAPPLGRAAWIEDLKAVLLFMEGEMAVAEDHGRGLGKAAAQARQPSLGRSRVMDYPDDLSSKLDFERRRQRALQRSLVDVAVDGMHDGTEGFELFERRDGEEIAGVDHGVGLAEQLDASLGQAARTAGHMGVGEDGDQTRTGF
jgi:hypothetical protein